MSLESAAKMAASQTLRGRTEAGCRQIGHGKIGQPGPAGKLASAAVTDPATVVGLFLVELAADPTVTDLACANCGHCTATDDAIRYVIDTHWDEIAARLYPQG